MSMSKVKSKKQKARLKARLESYEKLSNKQGYTKPGSNKK